MGIGPEQDSPLRSRNDNTKGDDPQSVPQELPESVSEASPAFPSIHEELSSLRHPKSRPLAGQQANIQDNARVEIHVVESTQQLSSGKEVSSNKAMVWLREAFKTEWKTLPISAVATGASLPIALATRAMTQQLGGVLSSAFASLSTVSWYGVFLPLNYYLNDRQKVRREDGSIDKEMRKQIFKSYIPTFTKLEGLWHGSYTLLQPLLEKTFELAPQEATTATHLVMSAAFTLGIPIMKHAWQSLFLRKSHKN